MIWMPSFLSRQLGFNLTKSALWTAVTVLGMMAGIWIFGQLADRIGRKPSFLLFQAGAVVMVLTYSQLTDPDRDAVGGRAHGHVRQRHAGRLRRPDVGGLPDRAARATAQNVLFNLGRGVGGFGPVVVGVLAAAYSFQFAIALLAAIYLIDMVATAWLIPELKGIELE